VRKRDHLEIPRCRWEEKLKWVIKKVYGNMDWIYLAQDEDKWWAVVKAVMNIRIE